MTWFQWSNHTSTKCTYLYSTFQPALSLVLAVPVDGRCDHKSPPTHNSAVDLLRTGGHQLHIFRHLHSKIGVTVHRKITPIFSAIKSFQILSVNLLKISPACLWNKCRKYSNWHLQTLIGNFDLSTLPCNKCIILWCIHASPACGYFVSAWVEISIDLRWTEFVCIHINHNILRSKSRTRDIMDPPPWASHHGLVLGVCDCGPTGGRFESTLCRSTLTPPSGPWLGK